MGVNRRLNDEPQTIPISVPLTLLERPPVVLPFASAAPATTVREIGEHTWQFKVWTHAQWEMLADTDRPTEAQPIEPIGWLGVTRVKP